jgi:hypothetical protein
VRVQGAVVWLDEVAEGALVAAASTVEEPPVRPRALRGGRLFRLLLGPDDDAVAAFVDRDSRVSPEYAVTKRASWRVAFRFAPQAAVRLAVPISRLPCGTI